MIEMIEIIQKNINELSEHEWDSKLLTFADGSYFQSYTFAKYSSNYHNYIPIFLEAQDENGTQGLLLYFIGLSREALGLPISISSRLARLFPEVRWFYGPLIKKPQVAAAFTNYLGKLKNTLCGTTSPYNLDIPQTIYEQGFLQFECRRSATIAEDLSAGENILWEKLEQPVKKSVKRTIRQGLYVKKVDSEDALREYYAVYVENRLRNRIKCPDYALFKGIWNDPAVRKYNEFYLVKLGERTISGQQVNIFNGIMIQMGISISSYALENKLYGNDLMQWELIKMGCERKLRWNDHGSYELEPKTEKEEKINHFKRKWGGRILHNLTISQTTPLIRLFKSAKRTLKRID